MVPPQASPTAQASSLLTPNFKLRALPSPSAASASAITEPSTHPPDTEPENAPSSRTAIWLPAGRGAEPQVRVTVASATLRFAPIQAVAEASGSDGVSFMMPIIAPPRERRAGPSRPPDGRDIPPRRRDRH